MSINRILTHFSNHKKLYNQTFVNTKKDLQYWSSCLYSYGCKIWGYQQLELIKKVHRTVHQCGESNTKQDRESIKVYRTNDMENGSRNTMTERNVLMETWFV